MEVHGFLKEHEAFMHYTVEDLRHDREVARHAAQQQQGTRHGEPAGEQRAG